MGGGRLGEGDDGWAACWRYSFARDLSELCEHVGGVDALFSREEGV